MALTISRYPDAPDKPLPPVLSLWFTALVAKVNYLLTGTLSGEGSPEAVVTAPQGTIWRRTDGGVGTTIYYKADGGTNPATLTDTGWEAVA